MDLVSELSFVAKAVVDALGGDGVRVER